MIAIGIVDLRTVCNVKVDSNGTGKDPNGDYNPDQDDYSLDRLMYVRG